MHRMVTRCFERVLHTKPIVVRKDHTKRNVVRGTKLGKRHGWQQRKTYCDYLFVALLVKVLILSAFLLLLSMSKSTLTVFFPPANRSDLGATV
jgi:hypothetical protein